LHTYKKAVYILILIGIFLIYVFKVLSKKKIYVVLRLSLGLSYAYLCCVASFATEVINFEEPENLALRTPKSRNKSGGYNPKRSKISENKDLGDHNTPLPVASVPPCGPPLSPTIKVLLDKSNIPLVVQYEMAYMAKSYTREIGESPEGFFDEEKWTSYLLLGGSSPKLKRTISCLKEEIPERIIKKSFEILNPDGWVRIIPSPVARRVFNRSSKKNIAKNLFPSIPVDAFTEEEREETQEERIERKALERKIFLTMEADQGLAAEDLKDILVEEKVSWHRYFQYFKAKKEAYQLDKTTGKIRRAELEMIFEKNVAKFYQKLIVDQYTLYYHPDLINLERQDTKRRTNLERMEAELCPIGPDGEEMNFHHLTHHDPGIIVLLSDALHKSESGKLHFPKSFYRRPGPVDRVSFDRSRKNMIYALLEIMLSQLNI
jgi:hypothetical protein